MGIVSHYSFHFPIQFRTSRYGDTTRWTSRDKSSATKAKLTGYKTLTKQVIYRKQGLAETLARVVAEVSLRRGEKVDES